MYKYLWLLFAFACGTPGQHYRADQLPTVRRPDTRKFMKFTVDLTVQSALGSAVRFAIPKEAAVCLMGFWQRFPDFDAAQVTQIRVAEFQSTDTLHVYQNGNTPFCLPTDIGIAHSHTVRLDGFCSHSDADAEVLASSPWLVSIVLCTWNNTGELLWQDGRRWHFTWR